MKFFNPFIRTAFESMVTVEVKNHYIIQKGDDDDPPTRSYRER
jgi:hypothetical protein